MGLTIRQKADRIGTFRFISVYLMETLARWVPTTPELEAKVLFGRHVWDFAQHADQLGRRTGELRAAAQYSLRPAAGYFKVLEAVASAPGTLERVAGFYDGFLPDLERRYRGYLAETDQLNDEPSVRIIERILFDLPRLKGDRIAFAAQRADLKPLDAGWATRIAALAAAEREFVTDRSPARTSAAV
ncbi:MAG: hypothetical protein OEV95_14445 [Gemmatimonadota bacterium]|nr:hypothetical protein [Gemmatimonadota bacterium]MDH5283366.1 hypothetical protein [Gemmatimonadota bacterium]